MTVVNTTLHWTSPLLTTIMHHYNALSLETLRNWSRGVNSPVRAVARDQTPDSTFYIPTPYQSNYNNHQGPSEVWLTLTVQSLQVPQNQWICMKPNYEINNQILHRLQVSNSITLNSTSSCICQIFKLFRNLQYLH